MKKRQNQTGSKPFNRLTFLIIVSFLLTGVITARLFYIQVVKHDYYEAKANKQHYKESSQIARRGEIFIKDYASNENIRVATNVTLDTISADPTQLPNKKIVADRIAPIIFDEEEAKKNDQIRVEQELLKAKTAEEREKIKLHTTAELAVIFHDDLFNKISQEIFPEISLNHKIGDDLSAESLNEIKNLHLVGIEVIENDLIAYPEKIADSDREKVAKDLSPYFNVPPDVIEYYLKGIKRYVSLKTRLKPEVSAKVREILDEDSSSKDKVKYFSLGIRLDPIFYRYYPENSLAANVLGYVSESLGKYGIESTFNTKLKGKNGIFSSQQDGSKHQITVGDVVIEPAVNGDNIVLTIDRSIQAKTEEILAKYVKQFKADNGQIIVMDPKTGKIMSMANFPTFNPNSFSEITEKEDISLSEDQIKNLEPVKGVKDAFWLFPANPEIDMDKVVFQVQNPDGSKRYQKYKNNVGDAAYQNKAVSEAYEPGSVFKIITMSAAIDDGDVKPTTTHLDPTGVLYLDKNKNGRFELDGVRYDAQINNVAITACKGTLNMYEIIQNSCNTGITWVAQKLGRTLLYNYMLKYGFNERTEIELDSEGKGTIPDPADPNRPWTDSELANHAFGQGVDVTPIQMISAFAAIANKGVLMEPHIVESTQSINGKIITTEPTIAHAVISEKTATTMAEFLRNNVENGASYQADIKLKEHYIGAKTGTAQSLDKHNKYQKGRGTTKATVVGFAPIDDPKFVILVKMDRPRTAEYADVTAGKAFRDVSEYLFDYFNLPPDK